ncbi:hypothetical protein KOW79_009567 [Hemibagrus wyckioides]|uniref:Uncharacterized protein n=1 Tax=Hemibagrus wyckioides TaxID=337641 RepID=A0A9D3SIY2_9TELE|nr:hypothetical protein KOW79_009567 [Hemibagrus wyckioides]
MLGWAGEGRGGRDSGRRRTMTPSCSSPWLWVGGTYLQFSPRKDPPSHPRILKMPTCPGTLSPHLSSLGRKRQDREYPVSSVIPPTETYCKDLDPSGSKYGSCEALTVDRNVYHISNRADVSWTKTSLCSGLMPSGCVVPERCLCLDRSLITLTVPLEHFSQERGLCSDRPVTHGLVREL